MSLFRKVFYVTEGPEFILPDPDNFILAVIENWTEAPLTVTYKRTSPEQLEQIKSLKISTDIVPDLITYTMIPWEVATFQHVLNNKTYVYLANAKSFHVDCSSQTFVISPELAQAAKGVKLVITNTMANTHIYWRGVVLYNMPILNSELNLFLNEDGETFAGRLVEPDTIGHQKVNTGLEIQRDEV
jgi:hypothetical protein